jgi:anaerobic magnesium-protoporphyrin IX monomethyl ester cyclase
MQNILFVNAPSCFDSYSGTRVNAVVQVYPLLSHASLAAVAKELGNKVEILDLGIIFEWKKTLEGKIREFRPDMICMSSTTPLFNEVADVSRFIRKIVGNNLPMVLGGPHPTAIPEDSLRLSEFDVVVTGEGENAFRSIIEGIPYKEILGVYFKEGDDIILSASNDNCVMDLDNLPYPAFELYDMSRYKCPRILNRISPMTNYMSSRGCVFKCSFCNKNIFGNRVRYKSIEKVIDEIKYMLKAGIREIRIIDDMFTTNMARAKKICEMILHHNLKFPWTLSAGLRVDCVDMEFLTLAKRAGLYQVAFGFESGDQKSLESIEKGIKLEQSVRAMELVKSARLESVGFFMFGLPGDSEESLKKTISFAKKLSPTYAKVTITIPFPGTKLYEDYERKGLIISKDWSKYNLHTVADIYHHPNLGSETLRKYYNKFYYSYYLRPSYILSSCIRTLINFTLFHHVYYGLQTFLPKIFRTTPIRT